ncbi:hypothetical protein BCR39DRAFT_573939 [Naematelia encephala]|uniref:Uncharacterized protein n=1 Tax=Naematelia encephala TaxID=71784 RepID=A0A1Y2B671_9TREE|nr:hypothetical protein BCR39DRAFT_573939 [Naematelia encephala]
MTTLISPNNSFSPYHPSPSTSPSHLNYNVGEIDGETFGLLVPPRSSLRTSLNDHQTPYPSSVVFSPSSRNNTPLIFGNSSVPSSFNTPSFGQQETLVEEFMNKAWAGLQKTYGEAFEADGETWLGRVQDAGAALKGDESLFETAQKFADGTMDEQIAMMEGFKAMKALGSNQMSDWHSIESGSVQSKADQEVHDISSNLVLPPPSDAPSTKYVLEEVDNGDSGFYSFVVRNSNNDRPPTTSATSKQGDYKDKELDSGADSGYVSVSYDDDDSPVDGGSEADEIVEAALNDSSKVNADVEAAVDDGTKMDVESDAGDLSNLECRTGPESVEASDVEDEGYFSSNDEGSHTNDRRSSGAVSVESHGIPGYFYTTDGDQR